jgi:hypothetical protein
MPGQALFILPAWQLGLGLPFVGIAGFLCRCFGKHWSDCPWISTQYVSVLINLTILAGWSFQFSYTLYCVVLRQRWMQILIDHPELRKLMMWLAARNYELVFDTWKVTV